MIVTEPMTKGLVKKVSPGILTMPAAFTLICAGTPVSQQRGEWLISHVYAVVGNGQEALRHAERCFELTETHRAEMKDFDMAYAHEGLARSARKHTDHQWISHHYSVQNEHSHRN